MVVGGPMTPGRPVFHHSLPGPPRGRPLAWGVCMCVPSTSQSWVTLSELSRTPSRGTSTPHTSRRIKIGPAGVVGDRSQIGCL